MTDENGVLSIDFLAGFTIFIIAFIWVVSMIPGLMIGLQSYTIDYDAVAYRTGVILVEDPGWPASPGWESQYNILNRPLKANITRFGLAVSKDSPNILSEDKVNRFFCWSATDNREFNPSDYRTRAIFGDYPYGFNISLIDLEGQSRSVGDVLPDGYGTIKRFVKIKGLSNATVNDATYTANNWYNSDNVTTHVFSILIDIPKLLEDIKDPAYQIDPAREQITINVTDLHSTTSSTITLKNVNVYKRDGGLYSKVFLPASEFPYIDGSSTRLPAMPAAVTDNVTLRFSPRFFDTMKAQNSQIYITLGFDVNPPSTFLNNTQALPDFDNLDESLTFDNPNTTPFNYNYKNVTTPYLRNAVLGVAIWSGSALGPVSGGGGGTNVSHVIAAIVIGGGVISPIGNVIVDDGANQVFTMTNNTGYHMTDVVVDGWSNGTISSYTFTNVVEDHTIVARFEIDTFTITPSAGVDGAINPGTLQTVNYGSTPTFTFIPDPGYIIDNVTVDGTLVTPAGDSYTFPAVTANHTINASFAIGPPVAAFSGTPVSGDEPLAVDFTDASTGFITDYAWDFDNDGTIDSTLQNPSHTYTVNGIYTVNLTVTGPGGSDFELKTNYITADIFVPPPVAAFSGTPVSGSAPLTVDFTDASTGSITGYAWDFDNDGTIDSTLQSPSHTYAANGIYTVNLTVTGPGGSDVELKTSYITVSTVVSFITVGTTSWTAPAGVTSVEYLVVGGGGGGGSYGGGGGAGGFRTASGYSVTAGNTYTITVGAGGAGGTSGNRGTSGSNSVFATITSNGGGGGGSSSNDDGRNGGSGGGATGTGTVGNSIFGQGNNGGTGKTWGGRYLGGGGGGASAAGGAATGSATPYTGGNGGTGSFSSITGINTQYAGGGGGGGSSNGGSTAGSGGPGGGGNGAVGNAAGSPGTANTGSGGGGGGSSPNNGGDGGSGIVIIKYIVI